MSKAKNTKKQAGPAEAALLGSGTVTIKQRENGKLVDREFDLIPYADLPRKARRELRNALFKAAPDAASATDKADVYLSAYDAGVIALRAAGAVIDPNDETLPPADADALDQTIMLVGLRVLGEMNAGSGDDPKGEENPPAETPQAD